MALSVIEFIGSIGGIAGVLAFVIFLIYRQDKKASEEQLRSDRKFMEDRLTRVLDDYNENCKETQAILREFRILLETKNGHH